MPTANSRISHVAGGEVAAQDAAETARRHHRGQRSADRRQNTFWLLQSLMGQTTRGTLKTCTVGVSVASVVALLLLLPLSLFL